MLLVVIDDIIKSYSLLVVVHYSSRLAKESTISSLVIDDVTMALGNEIVITCMLLILQWQLLISIRTFSILNLFQFQYEG